jgi:hypothetical protein
VVGLFEIPRVESVEPVRPLKAPPPTPRQNVLYQMPVEATEIVYTLSRPHHAEFLGPGFICREFLVRHRQTIEAERSLHQGV